MPNVLIPSTLTPGGRTPPGFFLVASLMSHFLAKSRDFRGFLPSDHLAVLPVCYPWKGGKFSGLVVGTKVGTGVDAMTGEE